MFENALKSVISLDEIESYRVIVQDNSVIEGNAERNRRFCAHFENVDYGRSSGDISMTENWAEGLARCSGKYFLRLDDDNFFLISSVSKLLSVAREYPDCLAFQFNSLYLDHNKSFNMAYSFEGISHYPNSLDVVFEATDIYEQLIEAESSSITDSNYLMLNREHLRQILPNPYQHPLPDRYVSISLLDASGGTGFFVSPALLGCSRFDYRSRKKQLSFKPSNYVNNLKKDLPPGGLVANFGYARAKTLKALRDDQRGGYQIERLSDFDFYKMALEGHLGELKPSKPLTRFVAEIRFRSYLQLFSLKEFCIRPSKRSLSKTFKNFILIFAALRFFLSRSFEHDEKVQPDFGDQLASQNFRAEDFEASDTTLFVFKVPEKETSFGR